MKKMMLVINPFAGRQQAKGFLTELICLFYQGGYEVTVFPTQSREQTLETVAQRACGYELLTCIGGDGTLNEVISGLMRVPAAQRPPLGYIPAGTTNDLAASLGIPRDAIEAGRAILSDTPLWYDIGGFNDRYFAYVAAFGAFTEVSYQTPQPLKNSLGYLAYVLEGMRRLTELHPYRLRVRVNGQDLTDSYVFGAVTNSTSIAGLFRLREEEVVLSDGL
ncbi:MAG: YegS/Rv2252/BmrU family lipid kinase, partial [Oscillospiraceae bacterium]